MAMRAGAASLESVSVISLIAEFIVDLVLMLLSGWWNNRTARIVGLLWCALCVLLISGYYLF